MRFPQRIGSANNEVQWPILQAAIVLLILLLLAAAAFVLLLCTNPQNPGTAVSGSVFASSQSASDKVLPFFTADTAQDTAMRNPARINSAI